MKASIFSPKSKTKLLHLAVMCLGLFFASCQSDPQSTPSVSSDSNEQQSTSSKRNILFFGDSITAGQGVDSEQAFPALIQSKIDSLKLDYTANNGGLSGETTSGGLRRIDWMLKEPVDVFIYELGANDGLRGIDLDITKSNSEAILERVIAKYPDAKLLIAGMMLPPNLGSDYTEKFASLYPDLAEKFDAALIPFLLKDVGGIPDLNQPDGIHPTPEGHSIISNTVWAYLEPLLED